MRQSFALLAIAITAGLIAGTASGSTARTAGALEVNDALISSYYKFDRAYCPAGVSAPADCVRFTGQGTIRGLGAVTTTYTKILPGVDPACVVVQNNTAVITVAGKGTIEVSRTGTICTPPAPSTIGPVHVHGHRRHRRLRRSQRYAFLPTVGRGIGRRVPVRLGAGHVGRHDHRAGDGVRPDRADDRGSGLEER